MILKLPLKSEIRNWMLTPYLIDHFDRSGEVLLDISFNQQIGCESIDITGSTILGQFAVKICDRVLSDEEVNAFYDLCKANNIHEGMLISQNESEDRKIDTKLYIGEKPMINWFRIRNIQDVIEYVTTNYRFEAILDGLNAYLIFTQKQTIRRSLKTYK